MMSSIRTATIIITCLTLAVLMRSTLVEAECTLCEGTYVIPNAHAKLGRTTCLDASMESIFHDESSETCISMRKEAKYVCGCEEEPEEEDEEQVDGGGEKDEEGGSEDNTTSDESNNENDNENENENVDEKEPPTSGGNEDLSGPTSILDEEPNCQDLIRGIYPFDESFVDSTTIIDYHAELTIPKKSSQNDNAKLDKDVIDTFQDAASRLVSAGAAGCYDRRRLFLRKVEQVEEHRIYYVKFLNLAQRNAVSCSESNNKDTTSTCIPIQGQIQVIYSSIPSQSWVENLILDIFTTQSRSISNVVEEVTKFDSVQLAKQSKPPAPSTSSTSDTLIISLGTGFSVFAILACIFTYCCIKRRSSYSNVEKRRQRRARKFEKKVERVQIMTNRRYAHLSDESSPVEYVDERFIMNGDDSVSNAPTIECKKVMSLESTIVSKTSFSDNSKENSKNQSSDGSNSSDGAGNAENDKFEDKSQDSFPLYSFESFEESSTSPSMYSEVTPYDEAASYMSRSRVANNNIDSTERKSVTFVDVEGHVVYNSKDTQTL